MNSPNVWQGPVGMPNTLAEADGLTSYTVDYDCDSLAQVEFKKYTTPNGTTRYRYKNYATCGLPTERKRIFSSINRQEWNGSNWDDGQMGIEVPSLL